MAGRDTSDIGEDGRSTSNASSSGSFQVPLGSNMQLGTDTDARNLQEVEVERVRARQMEQLQRKAEAVQRKATAVRVSKVRIIDQIRRRTPIIPTIYIHMGRPMAKSSDISPRLPNQSNLHNRKY